MIAVKIACSRAVDWPLETMTSRSNIIAKIVAMIAIAIFTICSLGYYAIYAKRFYADHKIQALLPQLEFAITTNDLATVNELFTIAPDLKKTLNGYQGRTPSFLHLAVDHQHPEMIDLLLANGADLHADSRMGTPLAVAVYRGHLNMMDYLLQKKADPNLGDGMRPPIMIAVSNTPEPVVFDVIQRLVGAKANLNPPGWLSPLSFVAHLWQSNPEKTRETLLLMLQNGARLSNEDHPIDMLEARQFIEQNTPQVR